MLNDSIREISDDEMDRLAGGTGGGKPHIDNGDCINCGVCAEECPKGCLTVVYADVLVRTDLCDGCGKCANVCPNGAIWVG